MLMMKKLKNLEFEPVHPKNVLLATRGTRNFLFISYQVLLDASNKHKHSTFGLLLLKKSPKNCFFLSFFAFFSTFGAGARPSALIIWKSRRTKVVPYEMSVRNF
jgi:hypothetical protein